MKHVRVAAAMVCALTAAPADPSSAQHLRPRDPWVFRGRVADVERAVTLALEQRMWVSYDTETCALRVAWNGSNGGETKAEARGARWLDGARGGVWWLVRNGQARELETVWRGYVFRGSQVTLRYELRLDDVRIGIEETPEFLQPTDLADDPSSIAPWVTRDMVGMRRTFRASGIPDGAGVSLTLADEMRGNLLSQDLVDPLEAPGSATTTRRIFARMPLRGADAWNELIYFFEGPASSRNR